METPQQITLGQVLEMAPGENGEKAYINDEFEAIVTDPKERTSKKGSKFWVCFLEDPHNRSIKLETTFFRNPGQYVGKVCYFSGNGMTREQYGQTQKVGLGRDTKITIMGKAPGSNPPQEGGNRGQAQENHRPPTQTPPQAQSSSFAARAVVEAIGLMKTLGTVDFTVPGFAPALHTLASDIMRVHQWLEEGKLAPQARGPRDTSQPEGGESYEGSTPAGGRSKAPIDEEVPF